MKKVSSREFMYIGTIILFPIALLFKGMYLYFAGAIVVSSLLILFDPIFKRLRMQVLGAETFIYFTFISGAAMGLFIHLAPELKLSLISVWFGINIFYGLKIARKIDDMNAENHETEKDEPKDP